MNFIVSQEDFKVLWLYEPSLPFSHVSSHYNSCSRGQKTKIKGKVLKLKIKQRV